MRSERGETLSSGQILYVLSDVRSGSTLLDQLLGAHSAVVSVGELHWLPAYVSQDRKSYNPVHPLVCACGSTVSECSFWLRVQEELPNPLGTYRFRPRFSMWLGCGSRKHKISARLKYLPMRLLRRTPSAYANGVVHRLFGGGALARDSIRVSDAILRASGKRVLVDSSKSTFKFWSVYRSEPDKVKAVILTRDYRAVVYSKMRRGESLEDAAIGWRRKMAEIEALTRQIDDRNCYKLKYESLCLNPELELTALCEFLNIDFEPPMLARPTFDVHNIGGSPSKFDPSKREIALDTVHQDVFDKAELSRIRSLVGDTASAWGY
jgi:hypothetical protein